MKKLFALIALLIIAVVFMAQSPSNGWPKLGAIYNNSTLGKAGFIDAPVGFINGLCTSTSTTAATLSLVGLGGNGLTCTNAWATGIGWVSSSTWTIKNLQVNLGTTKNANSYTFTIWQQACTTLTSGACTAWSAAAATAITCSVTASGTGPQQCTDTTHSITYAIGDIISMKWASVASDSVGNVNLTLEVHELETRDPTARIWRRGTRG
jgi:hypothetical protein